MSIGRTKAEHGVITRMTGVTMLLLVALAMLVLSPELGFAADEPTARKDDAPLAQPRRAVLRFLTEADFPPFDFYDEDGALTGFNVDLARAICLELAATCDIKVKPWEELLPALKRREADAVIAGHALTAKALVDADFTDRYFFTPARFAARRGAPKVSITPEGLDERRIAVAKGTPHEAYLKTFFPYSSIQVMPGPDLAREALIAGKVDFVFDDGVSLAFWANGSNSKQCCELVGGPFLDPRYFGEGMAIAVSRNDGPTLATLNTALRRVRESGRLEELMQRYFPFRIY